ncbi:MAG: hypothetical protein M3Q34_02310 [bacterium]|nr:hypothetical protein [bacterium]
MNLKNATIPLRHLTWSSTRPDIAALFGNSMYLLSWFVRLASTSEASRDGSPSLPALFGNSMYLLSWFVRLASTSEASRDGSPSLPASTFDIIHL